MINKSINFNKIFAIMLLVACIGDFAVPYLIAPFYKGYSHTSFVMSTLGNPESPVATIYNIWLILLGILLLTSSKLIYLKYVSVSKYLTISTVILIVGFSIGAGIVSGLFSVNSTKDIVTTASMIHGIGASLGFMMLLFVPLLLALLTFKEKNNLNGVFYVLCFILAFIFFILFVMADKQEFSNTWIDKEGL